MSNYYTTAQTQSAITEATSGKVDTTDFNTLSGTVTGHTADTSIHVTAQDKTNWNNKSDFSGNYNDLTNKPTIPTVPTNVSDFTNDAGYITSDDISGKTNQSDFTAHTANTTVHVTASEKSTWNSKSDFSGNYNDLSNKPTIPSKTSDLTNDSGYITSSALDDYTTTATTSALNDVVTAHTANTSIHVSAEQIAAWNAKSDFSGSYNDLTNKLSAGTNVSIVDNVISAEGGGKAVTGGTNISVTTGATADTINCTLSSGTLINISNSKINCTAPIRNGTGISSVIVGISTSTNKASGTNSIANGGDGNTASGQYSYAEGFNTQSTKNSSHSEGWFTLASGNYSHTEGNHTKTTNESEHASGKYNASSSASTTFGDSGNTLFSVGNGTADNARHNAFEIRQNGDIYLTKDGQDVKLQDQLGGGSITIDPSLDASSTNPVANSAITTAINAKASKNEAVGSYQFGATSNVDCINFKKVDTAQSLSSIYYPKINGKGILTSNYNWAKNNYDFQLLETSAITTSITSSSTDAQVPSAKAVNDKLGGLSIVKMTQSEYDALATKDSNTLYVING